MCRAASLWEGVWSRVNHAGGHKTVDESQFLSVPTLCQSISCSWHFVTDPCESSQRYEDHCPINATCILQTDNGAFCYCNDLPLLLLLTFKSSN